MNADLAIFLAFLKTKTSLIIKNAKATMSPTIEMTMKTMWGMKLESVMEVVTGRWAYLGMKIKIMMRMAGIATPIIEYI